MAESGNIRHVHPGGPVDAAHRLGDPVLQVVRLPGQQGLRVLGEVDLTTHRRWEDALESLAADMSPRLDLSGLSFIDAYGAAALVAVAQRMTSATTLTLYRPPLCLRRVLDMLWPGELPVITIEDEEAE